MPAARFSTVAGVSQLLHPIGPEPPVVYWVRRVAIVLVALTVILSIIWLVGALRGDGDSTASPVSSASAMPSASPGAATAGPTEPAASASPVSTEPVECKDADIEVSASTDSSAYQIGETPRLTLTITNSGDVACLRDVGPKANALEITSGGYHVWSSDDCNPNDKSKVVTLKPDESFAASIAWNGKVTQKGCPNEGTAAKPGRYDVVGVNMDVESEKVPFALTKKKKA